MTSRMEPLALRAASALSAVAELCTQWWAMKWYLSASRLPMSVPVWLRLSLTVWAVTGGTRAILSASSRVFVSSSLPGDHPVDQPQAPGLLRVDGVAGEQELLRLADAELPGLDQQLDAGPRQAQDRVGELGVVGGDDEVAHGRQHQTGRNAAALHGGDGRLAEVVDAHAAVVVHRLLVLELAFGRLPQGDPGVGPVTADQCLEVMARGEVLARTGQDHDPDRVVRVGQVEGGIELVNERRVLRVGHVRPVHGDGGHGTIDHVEDRLEVLCHLTHPCSVAHPAVPRAAR